MSRGTSDKQRWEKSNHIDSKFSTIFSSIFSFFLLCISEILFFFSFSFTHSNSFHFLFLSLSPSTCIFCLSRTEVNTHNWIAPCRMWKISLSLARAYRRALVNTAEKKDKRDRKSPIFFIVVCSHPDTDILLLKRISCVKTLEKNSAVLHAACVRAPQYIRREKI